MRPAFGVIPFMFCLLSVPGVALASPITGTGATEVSRTVDGSMSGQSTATNGPSRDQSADSAPTVAAGMPLSDMAGLPLMLIAPPQIFALAPHGKLRASSLVGEDAVNGNGGGGGGGLSNVSFQSGAPSSHTGGGGSAGQTIPEPATLFLAVPAIALALRRRFARRIA